jgi:hypothetical protein
MLKEEGLVTLNLSFVALKCLFKTTVSRLESIKLYVRLIEI